MQVQTGMRAFVAALTTTSKAANTETSPPIHSTSTSRTISDAIASLTAAVFSTVASSSSSFSSPHASRASFVQISELISAGFHAMPTRASFGFSCLAMRKESATGCNVPIPTMCDG